MLNLLYNRVNNISIPLFCKKNIDKQGKGDYNTIKPTNNVGLKVCSSGPHLGCRGPFEKLYLYQEGIYYEQDLYCR